MFHVILVKLILKRYWAHGLKNKLENHLESADLLQAGHFPTYSDLYP